MGWDTQINIIVENIVNEEIEIAKNLFESDAKTYFQNGMSFIKYREVENGLKVLFFTYERRKYLPYWTIQEVSKKFSDKYFTVVGSSPDFICGPAGILKIFNGEIIDSYGFAERFGDISLTTKVLEKPIPEVLFQCFGKNKLEELVRETYIEKHPKKWIDEKYYDNILEFKDEENEKFKTIVETHKDELINWTEIKQPTTSAWQYGG
jgi:hypothetical protein